MMNTINQLNYLAIEMLERFGNQSPSEEQISLMEQVLSSVSLTHKTSFNQRLNKKQIACLFWAARGKSSKETAELLGITPARVESARKEIKRKLGCSSIAQAVFEGIKYGYVTYPYHATMEYGLSKVS